MMGFKSRLCTSTLAIAFVCLASDRVCAYEGEPAAWGRFQRALLIDDTYCFSINLRCEPPGDYRFYVSRRERKNPSGGVSYSDLAVTLPERTVHLSSVWLQGGRVFILAGPRMVVPPHYGQMYSLIEYPLFDPGRAYTSIVHDGQMNIHGEVVQRSAQQKNAESRAIQAAIETNGFKTAEDDGGKARRLFFDADIYIRPSDGLTSQTSTQALTFVPFDTDGGAVALLAKNGQVFFFRYQYQGRLFNLKDANVELVNPVDALV